MSDDRVPTSHEQASGATWDASYQHGPAPWDIGGPQPAVVRLAAAGVFTSPVLDAGCGTGDNGRHLASLGLSVVGFDVADTAVSMARSAAAERGLHAEFLVADAFALERLGRSFNSVLDCGLLHTFDADERLRYVTSLASVVDSGGTVYVLCFSDQGVELGPHPVSQDELRAAFDSAAGWQVRSIEPETLETNIHENGAPAWLAKVVRRAKGSGSPDESPS